MLVLASRSPQRRAILEQLGVAFEVRPSDVEELTDGDPEHVALENARRKAAAVDGDLVLGVDTIVCLDGRIYGKPADEDEARATLSALGGRTHKVISGLAVQDREPRSRPAASPPRPPGGWAPPFLQAAATTEVVFRDLDAAWVDWYVATGEWCERAGGYAIQGRGAALVEEIRGDYLNVVGLPVAALLRLLPGLVR